MFLFEKAGVTFLRTVHVLQINPLVLEFKYSVCCEMFIVGVSALYFVTYANPCLMHLAAFDV